MNTETGGIYHMRERQPAPMPSVPLTKAEAEELGKITTHNRARLRRYKQMHAEDDCRSCGVKLRRHTLSQFQQCYSE